MKEGWKRVKIGDLGQVITGNTPPKKDPSNYGSKYPFIKPTDMDIDRRYVTSWDENYSEKAFKRYKNSYIPPKATGVVTIGTVGEKIFQADRYCFTNQSVNVVIPSEDYDEDFVYYVLKINLPKVLNANPGTASGRHHVSKSNFCAIKIDVPQSKETQRKIANILSAYDDLIENNLKRIQLLEEQAQQTYEEWFVRFKFPGHETAKFDEESGLPVGWAIKPLGDFTEVLKGKNITKATITEGSVPVVAGGLSPAYFHNKANTTNPIITVSASGANAGYVNLYLEDIWASDCSFIDSKMTENLFFIYCTLINQQQFIYHLQKGAAQPHVYPKDLKKVEIVIPSKDILQEFENMVSNNFNVKRNLFNQNQHLKEARDILLPRLMSGMIDVDGLEENEGLGMVAEGSEIYNKN
jgi:type I restriction enzyme S subunit